MSDQSALKLKGQALLSERMGNLYDHTMLIGGLNPEVVSGLISPSAFSSALANVEHGTSGGLAMDIDVKRLWQN
jgi:hypothetical protein